MGYKPVCTECGWEGEEVRLTKKTAEIEGNVHESEKHGGESCTRISKRAPELY